MGRHAPLRPRRRRLPLQRRLRQRPHRGLPRDAPLDAQRRRCAGRDAAPERVRAGSRTGHGQSRGRARRTRRDGRGARPRNLRRGLREQRGERPQDVIRSHHTAAGLGAPLLLQEAERAAAHRRGSHGRSGRLHARQAAAGDRRGRWRLPRDVPEPGAGRRSDAPSGGRERRGRSPRARAALGPHSASAGRGRRGGRARSVGSARCGVFAGPGPRLRLRAGGERPNAWDARSLGRPGLDRRGPRHAGPGSRTRDRRGRALEGSAVHAERGGGPRPAPATSVRSGPTRRPSSGLPRPRGSPSRSRS